MPGTFQQGKSDNWKGRKNRDYWSKWMWQEYFTEINNRFREADWGWSCVRGAQCIAQLFWAKSGVWTKEMLIIMKAILVLLILVLHAITVTYLMFFLVQANWFISQTEALDLARTVLQTVEEAADDWRIDDIKGLLGRCNFKSDMLDRKVSLLSGGEKVNSWFYFIFCFIFSWHSISLRNLLAV